MIAIRPLTSPTTSIGRRSRGMMRLGMDKLGNSNTDFLDSIVWT